MKTENLFTKTSRAPSSDTALSKLEKLRDQGLILLIRSRKTALLPGSPPCVSLEKNNDAAWAWDQIAPILGISEAS